MLTHVVVTSGGVNLMGTDVAPASALDAMYLVCGVRDVLQKTHGLNPYNYHSLVYDTVSNRIRLFLTKETFVSCVVCSGTYCPQYPIAKDLVFKAKNKQYGND